MGAIAMMKDDVEDRLKVQEPVGPDKGVEELKKIKEIVIIKTRTIELKKCKYWEENTAGIIIKNINGFVIPPVKNNNIPSCAMSKLKYIVEIELLIWFSFILKYK